MNLLLHDIARTQIDGLVASPGGSVLLHGPAGTGKRTAAVEIARRMNCEGCSGNSCRSCRLLATGAHPDVRMTQPDAMGKIGIDAVHELEHTLGFQQYGSRSRRVLIITRGHTMTDAAQNALLKLLEEPPVGSTVIITANGTQSLLETIVSRCRPIYIAPMGEAVIRDHLVREHGVPPALAADLAAASDGAVGTAIRLSGNPEVLDERRLAAELVRSLMASERLYSRLVSAAAVAADSDKLPLYVELATGYARRAARQDGNFLQLVPAVEKLRRRLAANVNPRAAFEALAIEVAC